MFRTASMDSAGSGGCGAVAADTTTSTSTSTAAPTEQDLFSFLVNHHQTFGPQQFLLARTPQVSLLEDSPVNQKSCSGEKPVRKKRSATEMQEDSTASPCPDDTSANNRKKAHFVLLAPLGPPGSPRREVHFELEETGDGNVLVKTHVRVFDRVDDADAANIWWSPTEMGQIQAREKSAVSVMSYCCEHFASQVLRILETARTERHHATKNEGGGLQPDAALPASPESVWVASSPARGLERDIVAGFKQRKRQVIRKVLESQRVLKKGRHKVTGEIPSLDMRSQLLSAQYHKWSHPMVRFAQELADGDAEVVVNDNNSNGMAPLEAF